MSTATTMPDPPDLPEVSSGVHIPVAPPIVTLPSGLHPGIAPSDYHARVLGLVSKSVLDLVNRSPAHYRSWVDGADDDVDSTEALAFGSAFHCALLEPERFAREFAVEPAFGDCRFKENKAKRDEWRRDHEGVSLMSAADARAIAGMIAAVRNHQLAGRMVSDGDPELTLRWQDEATGLQCKARADYYVRKHRMAVDVKSTFDARREAFRKDTAKYGYHRQDAFYRGGFEAVGQPVDHFVFVVVEKRPPHAVAIYALDSDGVSRGRMSVRSDMVTLADCLRKDEWPGYPAGIQELDLPPWAA